MSIVLKGKAHKAFTKDPENVLEHVRHSIVGDAEMAMDDSISINNLKIKTNNG